VDGWEKSLAAIIDRLNIHTWAQLDTLTSPNTSFVVQLQSNQNKNLCLASEFQAWAGVGGEGMCANGLAAMAPALTRGQMRRQQMMMITTLPTLNCKGHALTLFAGKKQIKAVHFDLDFSKKWGGGRGGGHGWLVLVT
jgi:hypothetical protein